MKICLFLNNWLRRENSKWKWLFEKFNREADTHPHLGTHKKPYKDPAIYGQLDGTSVVDTCASTWSPPASWSHVDPCTPCRLPTRWTPRSRPFRTSTHPTAQHRFPSHKALFLFHLWSLHPLLFLGFYFTPHLCLPSSTTLNAKFIFKSLSWSFNFFLFTKIFMWGWF